MCISERLTMWQMQTCSLHCIGWTYEGPLCVYEQRQVDGHDTGAMWECPFLVPLSSDPQAARNDGSASDGPSSSAASAGPDEGGTAATSTYVLCVSPYPHRGPSTNACLYWLGEYQEGRFDIDAADGATCDPVRGEACCESTDL